jgi:sporulation protein YlmC with PRC-barrel domain
MHLARDLLDNQVYDVKNRRIGRVDGIVIVPRRGKVPRVSRIELGLPVLARRVSRRLADWLARLEERLGIGDGTPVRIDLDRIEHIGIDVHTTVDASRTDAYAWEMWIDRVLVCRIPGSGRGVPGTEEK